MISEYGYCACTPDRPEGDSARVAVLLDHDKVFRQRDFVAGLIFFCYNDYRTHVGDRGVGVMQQRVHGVVDVYGARKPSYEVLRVEASPLRSVSCERQGRGTEGAIRRPGPPRRLTPFAATLLRAVVLRFRRHRCGAHRNHVCRTSRPAAQTSAIDHIRRDPARPVKLDLLRPTGSSAHTAIWKP